MCFALNLQVFKWSIKIYSFVQKNLLSTYYTPVTPGMQSRIDRQPPCLHGYHFSWRHRQEIDTELKDIITDHNKGIMRYRGQGHFRQTGEESSHDRKPEKRSTNYQSLIIFPTIELGRKKKKKAESWKSLFASDIITLAPSSPCLPASTPHTECFLHPPLRSQHLFSLL